MVLLAPSHILGLTAQVYCPRDQIYSSSNVKQPFKNNAQISFFLLRYIRRLCTNRRLIPWPFSIQHPISSTQEGDPTENIWKICMVCIKIIILLILLMSDTHTHTHKSLIVHL